MKINMKRGEQRDAVAALGPSSIVDQADDDDAIGNDGTCDDGGVGRSGRDSNVLASEFDTYFEADPVDCLIPRDDDGLKENFVLSAPVANKRGRGQCSSRLLDENSGDVPRKRWASSRHASDVPAIQAHGMRTVAASPRALTTTAPTRKSVPFAENNVSEWDTYFGSDDT